MQRLVLAAAFLLASVSAHADVFLVKAGDTPLSVKTGLSAQDCQALLTAAQAKLPTGAGLTAACVADNEPYTGAHLQ